MPLGVLVRRSKGLGFWKLSKYHSSSWAPPARIYRPRGRAGEYAFDPQWRVFYHFQRLIKRSCTGRSMRTLSKGLASPNDPPSHEIQRKVLSHSVNMDAYDR